MEYTNEQLEEMVVGKPQRANAVFYEKAALNVEKSKATGQRVYETKVYIQMKQAGMRDSVSYIAREQDIREFPEEYAHFQRTRQGQRETVPISIIPGMELAHMQELLDLGLTTVDQLAEATVVPAHLLYAQRSARTLNQVLQEQKDGNEEKSQQEEIREAAVVPAEDRPEHPHGQRRPEVPASNGVGDGEVAEGHGAGRPEHSRQGLSYNIDNWSIEL